MKKAIALTLILTLAFSSLAGAVGVPSVKETSWVTMSPIPKTLGVLRAAVANGKIYVMGESMNYEYNPATNKWVSKTPMPTPRSSFGIAVYQNKIYTIGGGIGWTQETGPLYSGVNEVYDPSNDTWETKKPIPTNISDIDVNSVEGKIYVINGLGRQAPTSSVNFMYDIANDSWTNKSTMPYPVTAYASAVANDKIFIFGGIVGGVVSLNYQTQIYDTKFDSWSIGAPIPTSVFNAAAGATTGIMAPKRIYVIGGETGEEGLGDPGLTLNQVYDPDKDAWTLGEPMPTARLGLTVAVVNDQIYAIAGTAFNVFSANLKVNEQYTPIGYGTVPPAVSVVSPQNNDTYTMNNVSLAFTVNKPVLNTTYSLDGRANMTLTGNTTLTGLSEGVHDLVVYAIDTLGNTGRSETIFFTVDFPPIVIVLSPANKTYDSSNIPLTFTVNEPVSWAAYALDGRENFTISGNTTLAGLSVGSHTLRVYGNDTAGNTGASETVYFSINEPFPTTYIIASVTFASIAAIVGLAVYFKKRKH